MEDTEGGAEEKGKVLEIRCRNPDCTNRQSEENIFKKCARCGAMYCSRECQVKDWKATHKLMCVDRRAKAASQKVESKMMDSSVSDEESVMTVLNQLMAYTSPFAVYQASQVGKGILFAQTEEDARRFRYTGKVDEAGKELNRVLYFHYVTEKELETEILPNIPELEKHKGQWRKHLKKYLPKSQLVMLVKTGCGFSRCQVVPLEPKYQMCLGAIHDNLKMYQEMDQLEVNLDTDERL